MKKTMFCLAFLVVAAVVFSAQNGIAAGGGKAVFDAKGCAGCHALTGKGGSITLEAARAEKGPGLWYSGDKYVPGFLAKWLSDPKPIRPLAYYSLTERTPGNHPKLSAADAAAVADYLMTLKSGRVTSGVVKPGKSHKGQVIFEKKLGCYGCHLVKRGGDSEIGGLSGPTLVSAGKRINPDWLYAYIKNPGDFGYVMMPIFAGIITDEELKELVKYVSTIE